MTERSGEVVVLTEPGGIARAQVGLQDGSVPLTRAQMGELYGTTPQNISQHVRAIYAEGEQDEGATCKERLQVRTDRNRWVSRIVGSRGGQRRPARDR